MRQGYLSDHCRVWQAVMTFVDRDEIVAHGSSMSRRIRRKFPTFAYRMEPIAGIFAVVVRKCDCARAQLVLTTTDYSLGVSGYVSKSAAVLYKRVVGNFFRFRFGPGQTAHFFAAARDRAEVVLAEEEINKLLTLHLYRSREARLSMMVAN